MRPKAKQDFLKSCIAVYAYFLASMCIYEKNSDLLTHQSLYRLWLNKR